MGRRGSLILLLLAVSGVRSGHVQHVESELSQLPKLFHLDDYEQCLNETNGIYCHGTFQVYSDVEDHPIFALIEKYSQDPDLYNRSYLYRGYCLSERCAGADANLSARFEQCVDKWAKQRHGLRARLLTLSYCHEHGKPRPRSLQTNDTPHRVFLYVVLTLLALNIIGTIYDLNVEKKGDGDKLLRMWSLRKNWKLLSAPDNFGSESCLDCYHGIKAIMVPGVMYCHASILLSALPQKDPRFLEKFLLNPPGPFIGALTTVTQVHMVISLFLTSYSVLMSDQSFKDLPRLIAKRFARMLPVYALTIGFAATWWTSAGDGPSWHMVEAESAVCRRKFWTLCAFLQNFFEHRHFCLIQTWIMAVDMQCFIPVLILTIILKKCERWALSIIQAMFVGAVALVTHLAFQNNYVPAFTYMTPEDYRTAFHFNKSFTDLFIQPTNCLIAAVCGMWLAFYQKHVQDNKINLQSKLTVFLSYFCYLCVYIWAYLCYYFKNLRDPWFDKAMVPIERGVYGFLSLICCINFMNVNSRVRKFMCWKNFVPISRMALSISMVHWCINGIIIGNRYNLVDSSIILLAQDTITTIALSLILAVPLTIMVDFPMQGTIKHLLNL